MPGDPGPVYGYAGSPNSDSAAAADRQWFSWSHLADWPAIVRAGLGLDPGVHIPNGIIVAATEFPVRNREPMATLRKHLHRPARATTPAPLLKLGAMLLRADPLLGLTGRHVASTVLPKPVSPSAIPPSTPSVPDRPTNTARTVSCGWIPRRRKAFRRQRAGDPSRPHAPDDSRSA